MSTVYIACDDSGFEAKMWIIDYLQSNNITFVDCGSGPEPSRYPYYAARVASAVSQGIADKGILICGSGIGMSIAANKYKGVRAAMVCDSYSAKLTRRHNDSNILCLGGRMTGKWQLIQIVDTWINTEYDSGHHEESLHLIQQLEDVMFNENIWCPEDKPYPDFNWNPNQSL